MRTPVRCVTALFAILCLTGCAGNVAGTAAGGTVVPAPSTRATPPSTPSTTTPATTTTATTSTAESEDTLASGVTIDELADDLDQAPKVVDGFWTRHWSDFFTGTYTPPTVVGLYDGSDPADTPSCGNQPLEAYNASYCTADGTVAWDANLLVDGVDQIGDSWVYLVIAHEWGHAIQDQLEDSLVAVGEELQADCLAAAALYGAAADGVLTFDMGDDAELIGSLTALADQMPWTMSSDHGDPFQRLEWFTLGRNGGVQACFDVLETSDGAVGPTATDTEAPTSAPTS
jgi:predicted metalloprotease